MFVQLDLIEDAVVLVTDHFYIIPLTVSSASSTFNHLHLFLFLYGKFTGLGLSPSPFHPGRRQYHILDEF